MICVGFYYQNIYQAFLLMYQQIFELLSGQSNVILIGSDLK